MRRQSRDLKNSKSNVRAEALRLWKSGWSISEIARNVQKSRETIYRWVKMSDQDLAKRKTRERKTLDQTTRFRILELMVLGRSPSMKKLAQQLDHFFHIQLTEVQLRYFLKKIDFYDYKPSAFYSVIQEISNSKREKKESVRDRRPDVGIAHKSPEHSSPLWT